MTSGRRSKQLRGIAFKLATKPSIRERLVGKWAPKGSTIRYPKGSARWWYQKLKREANHG